MTFGDRTLASPPENAGERLQTLSDAILCGHCGYEIPPRARRHGAARNYCSDRCRKKAHDARKRGEGEQLAMFVPRQPRPTRAYARPTDPGTSHAAAASVASERITATRSAILGILQAGPKTDVEIAAAYARSGGRRVSPSGLRTRRSELVALGLVVDSGERATLDSGRRAIVWRLA